MPDPTLLDAAVASRDAAQKVVDVLSAGGSDAKGGLTSVTIHYGDGTTADFDLEAETPEDQETPAQPVPPSGEGSVMTPGTQPEG